VVVCPLDSRVFIEDLEELWTQVGTPPKEEEYPTREEFDRVHETWREHKIFNQPPPASFRQPGRPIELYSLLGRRLQAIVKMSNILLTLENPEYLGGKWHVDGMANERIVATGIYYYDIENITEGTLSFREMVGLDHYRNNILGAERLSRLQFNDKREAELVQEVGRVITKQGRCIVFPNFYEHKVSGFRLKDPSKPGHRKHWCFSSWTSNSDPINNRCPPSATGMVGYLVLLYRNCLLNSLKIYLTRSTFQYHKEVPREFD
jgi:hypothetical protein